MAKFSLSVRKSDRIFESKTQCLVIPVFEDLVLSETVHRADGSLGGAINRLIDLGDFRGTRGAWQWLPGNETIQRVLLVGAGDIGKFNPVGQYEFAGNAARALASGRASDALMHLGDLPLEKGELATLLEHFGRELALALYRYSETLSKPGETPALKRVTVNPGALAGTGKARLALQTGFTIGEGANLARELVNLPGNICTPRYLSQQARKLAKRFPSISTSVLDEKKMRELGMHTLLSVGNGSDEPSQLIVMEYKGGKPKAAPYALVGKGITFDTGGISLKPGLKMDEMKFDMGGAASVFGTLQAIAELELPINVVGVVAAAENMPSGRATKPGDVVKSLSGKTVEILNTDAEGRLVLCDALTYVGRYKPAEVVDIATLTGAIIVSLGNHATGVFANDDELAESLLAAGESSQDRGWRLPIWDDYQKQLESRFADIANIGIGGNAGSITAACFLARFTEEYRWAHLDIAGTAFQSTPKGGTGRPVPMLVNYLRGRAGSR